MAEAALCYAAGHGDRVRALIAGSRAFSPEEREALSAMREDFFRCLAPSTGLQRVSSTLLRYRLVEALLRLPPSAESSARQGN